MIYPKFLNFMQTNKTSEGRDQIESIFNSFAAFIRRIYDILGD